MEACCCKYPVAAVPFRWSQRRPSNVASCVASATQRGSASVPGASLGESLGVSNSKWACATTSWRPTEHTWRHASTCKCASKAQGPYASDTVMGRSARAKARPPTKCDSDESFTSHLSSAPSCNQKIYLSTMNVLHSLARLTSLVGKAAHGWVKLSSSFSHGSERGFPTWVKPFLVIERCGHDLRNGRRRHRDAGDVQDCLGRGTGPRIIAPATANAHTSPTHRCLNLVLTSFRAADHVFQASRAVQPCSHTVVALSTNPPWHAAVGRGCPAATQPAARLLLSSLAKNTPLKLALAAPAEEKGQPWRAAIGPPNCWATP